MSFDVHLQLDILFATSSDGRQTEQSACVIHVMESSTGMKHWVLENGPGNGVPAGGFWRWLPGAGGNLVIADQQRQPFATLSPFMYPPGPGAQGGIRLAESRRPPAKPGSVWRGTGKWTFAKGKPQNTPESVADTWTWLTMKRNIWDLQGKPLGWHLTTSRGLTVSGGAGGRGGEFTPYATIYMERSNPPFEERGFNYMGGGFGYMLPGAGSAISMHDLPSMGTEITRGNLPLNEPLKLEDLEGPCLVVDINFGGAFIASAPSGAGGGALGIIFGVPGGLAVGAYKACGWVAGMTVNSGHGASLGAVLNVGYLTLDRNVKAAPPKQAAAKKS